MLHLPALPGTPGSTSSVKEIMEKVEEETEIYLASGVDGLILENMHDTPYCLARDLEPHITATMAVLASRVRNMVRDTTVPVGVQVLAGGNREAVAVAQAARLQFVRAEGFVFSHVADEGWLDGCAGPLLRYRTNIGAGEVRVLCDIKKKHSAHSVTADVNIAETARAAGFFRADGVIVTGGSTGQPADTREVQNAETSASTELMRPISSLLTAWLIRDLLTTMYTGFRSPRKPPKLNQLRTKLPDLAHSWVSVNTGRK